MSTVKHVPLETGEDTVGTVRVCDCCRRPWVLRRILSPFGPVQRFMGVEVLKWTPETLRERLARRWWQFKATFKRTQEQKDADDRAERRAAELRRGGQSDPRSVVPRVIIEKPQPSPMQYTFFEETAEAVVSEEMRKKVWEE